ncbi:FtsW/RodA/SpoVE family cell cycle protein [Paenibacillus shunpengii]|uniref:FtsW/RodA/SpoVE family cell cycle protein n=1 Tax=Paenibacillus shunpengii TaxID=2054424 RepID=A0ABW5SME6_9BACL
MLSHLKKIDWTIVIILCFFMVASILLIHSGIQSDPIMAGSDKTMLLYYMLGFVVLFGTAFINYKLFIKYHWILFAAGLLLLLYVAFFGDVINGAKGWISLGPVNVQPAEVFKFILILSLAAIVAAKQRELFFWKDVVPISLLTFVPFAFVMVQNDMGNALCYVVILLGILWIGNMKNTHTLLIMLLIAVLVYGGIKSYIGFHDEITSFLTDIDKEHWLDRFDAWLLPDESSKDATYHTNNAKLAIASGGLFGKGFLSGAYVQSGFVPYTYSDSIIVVAAEEFGFLGVSVILFLYFIIVHRLITIALECKSSEGPVIIVGIVSMLLYQIFENIGMFIGLMPLTGITLPFLSFGGSSLLINMACMGVVLSIRLYDEEPEELFMNPHPSYLMEQKERSL